MIHRHLVAVERAPAERRFGQIARADDEAAAAVRQIHQNLRAFPRLRVLVSRVENVLRVPDVGEVLLHCGNDGNFLRGNAEPLHQIERVPARARRRSRPGQRVSANARGIEPEPRERLFRDENRERRIQTAGNAEHDVFRLCVLQPAHQPRDLDFESFAAAFALELRLGGNERSAGNFPGNLRVEFRVRRRQREMNAPKRRRLSARSRGEKLRVRPPPVREQAGVRLRENQRAFARKLFRRGEHFPVLRDKALARVNDVRRRLARSRARVDVGGDAARRLRFDERAAETRFPDDFAAGGKVENQRRSRGRELSARRLRDPKILADFRAERAFPEVFVLENQIRPDGNGVAAVRDFDFGNGQLACRREPAPLVKFARVREMRFRDDAENHSAAEHDGAVVDALANQQRRADDRRDVRRGGDFRECAQALFRLAQQLRLKKQIAAGIARQRQLRERDDRRVLRRGAVHHCADFAHVRGNVRQTQRGRSRRDFHQTEINAGFFAHAANENAFLRRTRTHFFPFAEKAARTGTARGGGNVKSVPLRCGAPPRRRRARLRAFPARAAGTPRACARRFPEFPKTGCVPAERRRRRFRSPH